MRTLRQLFFSALVLSLSSLVFTNNEVRKSIDQMIMEAAPKSTMFDTFHMSPEGDVMVMVELDMLMSIKQYMELKIGDQKVSRIKRKAVLSTELRWPNCYVYYELSKDLQGDVRVILQAMEEWEKYTCLSFKNATASTKDKIVFKNGDGCFSRLGRVGGEQVIGLARGCFDKGVVVHEIGHAIGWIHEQARPDRDGYIRVNYNRIPTSWHPQFDKFGVGTINTYNIEYDYRSVMHYSGNALALRSIETLDPAFQEVIGQRRGLSFRDVKLANVMYDCAKMSCPNKLKTCREFGSEAFQDKECKCVCPGNDTHPVVPCVSPATTTTPSATTTTLVVTTSEASTSTAEPPPMECVDLRPDCPILVQQKACTMDTAHMLLYCKKACNFCDKDEAMCMDFDPSCPLMALGNFCNNQKFAVIMTKTCKKSCKLCTPTDPCQMQKDLGLDSSSAQRPSYFWSLFLMILTIQWLVTLLYSAI